MWCGHLFRSTRLAERSLLCAHARERGARALEERLGSRKPASVPVSTTPDIEAGVAEDSAQVASAAGEGPLE